MNMNVQVKVREGFKSFTPSEQKIAKLILNDFEDAVNLPIAALSEKAGVSKATLVRFSKTLGFSGLKELKREMVSDLTKNIENNIKKSPGFLDVENVGSLTSACELVSNNSIKSIEDTFQIMDFETLEKVRDKILVAKTVRLYGVGSSGLVAQDLFYKLIRIGINTMYTPDSHINFASVTAADQEDVVIVFSHSGQTSEIIEIASIAKKLGVCVVAITRYGRSKLLDTTDLALYTSTPEQEKRSGAMGSRIAQLMIVDTLFTVVAKQSFDNNWGSIEEKLTESYNIARKYKIQIEKNNN